MSEPRRAYTTADGKTQAVDELVLDTSSFIGDLQVSIEEGDGRIDSAATLEVVERAYDRMSAATPADMVRQFHEVFGAPIAPEGYQGLGDEQLRRLRAELIREEFVDELLPALGLRLVATGFSTGIIDTKMPLDRVEVADALGDLIYVIYGAALSFGIPLDAVVAEIHRSNMTKLGADGRPIYRVGDQKVLKGPNYEPPQIARVLGLED